MHLFYFLFIRHQEQTMRIIVAKAEAKKFLEISKKHKKYIK